MARFLLGAFGDPGHTFPLLALSRGLRARGHDVTIQTWKRWRPEIEAEGLGFEASPEYRVFPTRERPLKPYEAVLRATRQTREVVARLQPDVVVADILTLAPALAAELEGVKVATLIPHVHPRTEPGFPPYSLGARLPRTRVGSALWRRTDPLIERGLQIGRGELNETRRRLGLKELDYVHNGISRSLCLVATFPALEYPRTWHPHEHVIGPLLWEPPSEPTTIPAGDGPLVVVAPSTVHDHSHRLLNAALEGLADLPVRVLGTWNRREPPQPLPEPANAVTVEWLSYSRAMPHADVVITHAGHGTVVRALASGAVVVACPEAGDMNENAARVEWSGTGVRVPRACVHPRAVRLAVQRALCTPRIGARVAELAAWAQENDAAATATGLLEELSAAG